MNIIKIADFGNEGRLFQLGIFFVENIVTRENTDKRPEKYTRYKARTHMYVAVVIAPYIDRSHCSP